MAFADLLRFFGLGPLRGYWANAASIVPSEKLGAEALAVLPVVGRLDEARPFLPKVAASMQPREGFQPTPHAHAIRIAFTWLADGVLDEAEARALALEDAEREEAPAILASLLRARLASPHVPPQHRRSRATAHWLAPWLNSNLRPSGWSPPP